MFYKIPKNDAFTNKRTARYVGKVARSDNTTLPKKCLATWINKTLELATLF